MIEGKMLTYTERLCFSADCYLFNVLMSERIKVIFSYINYFIL